jgi:hypothetical protein
MFKSNLRRFSLCLYIISISIYPCRGQGNGHDAHQQAKRPGLGFGGGRGPIFGGKDRGKSKSGVVKKGLGWQHLAARRTEKERQKATTAGLAMLSHQSGTRAAMAGWVATTGIQ